MNIRGRGDLAGNGRKSEIGWVKGRRRGGLEGWDWEIRRGRRGREYARVEKGNYRFGDEDREGVFREDAIDSRERFLLLGGFRGFGIIIVITLLLELKWKGTLYRPSGEIELA